MSENAIIRVENLNARFGERQVLKDITFTIKRNQITIIIGKSGSGKTTVLKHLIGLYEIQSGKVVVMDKELDQLSEKERYHFFLKIGVLFQNSALLNSLTLAENVAIPYQQHTDLPNELIGNMVRAKLNLVNLEKSLDLYPSQLSGGMRKRAALARAIAMDPPLLFCDEPSAGLDPITLASLDELILNLKSKLGITIVLVTHEVSSIFRLADKIIFLEDGQMLYQGTLADGINGDNPQIREFFSKAKGKSSINQE